MKKLILFLNCLLTSLLGFSQNSYPTKIVYNKDTLVAITPVQLRIINAEIVSSQLKDLEIERYRVIVNKSNDIITLQDANISNLNAQISNYRLLQYNNNKIYQEQKNLLKIEKKRKGKSIFISISVSLCVGTIIGLLIN